MARGRPTKYQEQYAEQAKKLASRGLTDFEIADVFGVHRGTLWRWANDHEDFCDALRAGHEVADNRVERTLFEKAVGYSFNSEKIFHSQGEIVRADIVEHVPPSDVACIFWLKNRRRDKWRDKFAEDDQPPNTKIFIGDGKGGFDKVNDD